MSAASGGAAGVLLVLFGLWLLLQTLVGGLVQRLVNFNTGSSTSSGADATANSGSNSGGAGTTATPGTQPGPGQAAYVPPALAPLPGKVGSGTTATNVGNPKSPPAPT